MARPVLRLATRLTARTRATAWAIAFACMVLVGSLSLVEGLASGVSSVADRVTASPYVYVEDPDLLSSRIDPEVLSAIPSDVTTIRIRVGVLEINRLVLDVVVVAVQEYRDGTVAVPYPDGRDEIALDIGLRERVLGLSGLEPESTGALTLFGLTLTDLPIVNLTGARPELFPDAWAYVRPDLLLAMDPVAAGPLQAILSDIPLDPALEASLGLTRLDAVGAIGFVRGGVAQVADSLRVLAAFIAVVIGLLVYAAMSLEVHQRRAEIAAMRSLGASPRIVLGVYESQALVLALAGAVLGSALGVLLAHAVVSFAPLIGLTHLVILEPPVVPVLLTFAIAILAAGAAGLVPSRRAARIVLGTEAGRF